MKRDFISNTLTTIAIMTLAAATAGSTPTPTATFTPTPAGRQVISRVNLADAETVTLMIGVNGDEGAHVSFAPLAESGTQTISGMTQPADRVVLWAGLRCVEEPTFAGGGAYVEVYAGNVGYGVVCGGELMTPGALRQGIFSQKNLADATESWTITGVSNEPWNHLTGGRWALTLFVIRTAAKTTIGYAPNAGWTR